MAGGGSVESESTVGRALVSDDGAEAETEEDVDRTSDGEEAENRQGEKEHGGDDEEDLYSDDLGAEVALEDVIMLSE